MGWLIVTALVHRNRWDHFEPGYTRARQKGRISYALDAGCLPRKNPKVLCWIPAMMSTASHLIMMMMIGMQL
jgi:hypothetical protein